MNKKIKTNFRMKWWGWGDPFHRVSLSTKPGIEPYLKKHFQCELTEACDREPLSLSEFKLPPSCLQESDLEKLRAIVGRDDVIITDFERLVHSSGKSYKDTIHLRLNQLKEFVDAVVYPKSEQEVSQLLKFAQEAAIAVIPFGGGTSVVGGLEVIRKNHRKIISIDLCLMDKFLSVDQKSKIATFECGIFGPALEKCLSEYGLTLGHFPQSFEYSTLGGWIAARSSGQNSAGYGAIEEMIVSLTIVTPSGEITTRNVPREATGPSIKELIIGSEGILGIITKACIRVSIKPKEKLYFMFAATDFERGMSACRKLVQDGFNFHLLRLSNEEETEAFMAMGKSSNQPGVKQYLIEKYLYYKNINFGSFCTMLVGCEGYSEINKQNHRKIKKCLEEFDMLYLGTRPGEKWLKERFTLPYLRDEFMNLNLLVDTLETSAIWSNLPSLYKNVNEAAANVFKSQKVSFKLYTHISHVYEVGASLYFTLIANQTDTPLEQWFEVKEAVNKAIIESQGTISHHHGIGVDHARYAFNGPLENKIIQSLKNELDPTSILNPGKVLS